MGKERKIVHKRDNGKCRLCKRLAVDIHHIVYKSHGGTDDERNLICLCRTCHEKVHSDEKYYRDYLLNKQRLIYGIIEIDDLKNKNKWVR